MTPSATAAPSIPAAHLPRLRAALLDHYRRTAQPLPWRGETDPYRILVSEVMLQQTRVETVLDYYGRWLERFPDFASLARASEDEVLAAWAGLGYYRRARLLHACGRAVMAEHGGRLPERYEELLELPGLGRYTAGAVAAIAFGEPVSAVDGNVRRVLARLAAEPEPTDAWLRETAALLVAPDAPGDWTQALMDLGQRVCTPRKPACEACPVAQWCGAYAAHHETGEGAPGPEAFPAPKARKAPRTETYALAVLHRAGRVLLERRPAGGLLGGMWALPERALNGSPGPDPVGPARLAAREAGWSAGGARPLPPVRHRFTHIDATYLPVLLRAERRVAPEDVEGARAPADPARRVRWVGPAEAAELGVPVAQRKVLEAAWAALGAVPGGTDVAEVERASETEEA